MLIYLSLTGITRSRFSGYNLSPYFKAPRAVFIPQYKCSINVLRNANRPQCPYAYKTVVFLSDNFFNNS